VCGLASKMQALHFAAMAGRTEVCKVLVEAGADLDQSNITGMSVCVCVCLCVCACVCVCVRACVCQHT